MFLFVVMKFLMLRAVLMIMMAMAMMFMVMMVMVIILLRDFMDRFQIIFSMLWFRELNWVILCQLLCKRYRFQIFLTW